MTTTKTVGATGNIQKDVPVAKAEEGLTLLLEHDPDFFGVQEWKSGRNVLLRDLGVLYVGPLKRLVRRWPRAGYVCARPLIGGAPIGLRAERYRLRRCHGRVLAGPGRVDKSPGRRSVLGATVATVAVARDIWLGETVTVINIHLTAEVQRDGRYRTDRPLRVARHRREVAALERIIRRRQRRGDLVYVVGDTNFDDLELAGLVSCWDGHHGGSLGKRAVDFVFAPDQADDLATQGINSDHLGVIATYIDR